MIKAILKQNPRFLTSVEIGNSIQLLDEPVSLGGNNQGPTPVQSIYGALAGCICMTLRIYSDRNNIPLNEVIVEVNATKKEVKREDALMAGKEHMIDKGKVRLIDVKIKLTGDISNDQLDKLDKIAVKCPVHKMLEHGSIITHKVSLSKTVI